jgi:hypothetical protein
VDCNSIDILRSEQNRHSPALAPLIRFVLLLYPSLCGAKTNNASGRFVLAVHADRCGTVASFCSFRSANSLSHCVNGADSGDAAGFVLVGIPVYYITQRKEYGRYLCAWDLLFSLAVRMNISLICRMAVGRTSLQRSLHNRLTCAHTG